MRVFLEIVFEMVVVLIVAELFAAVLALPLWMAVMTFLWTNVTYLGAFYFTSAIMVGICTVTWMLDMTKGVNL